MIKEQAQCARPECGKEFTKTTHNMKYCCNTCTRIATNEKIKADYHYNKAIERNLITRYCKRCNEVKLSRYNKTKYCAPCAKKMKSDTGSEVAALTNSISW